MSERQAACVVFAAYGLALVLLAAGLASEDLLIFLACVLGAFAELGGAVFWWFYTWSERQ